MGVGDKPGGLWPPVETNLHFPVSKTPHSLLGVWDDGDSADDHDDSQSNGGGGGGGNDEMTTAPEAKGGEAEAALASGGWRGVRGSGV